jgi:DNA topoisomerase II
VDHSLKQLGYAEFVNKELVLFARADCGRSIPSLVDGLKPAQRKVLFSCFKRKLNSEIKVAQLCGYVSEHSAYHHGESSLQQTIISMAQNYVGSNNINLLSPIGQFGTRIMCGRDSASPRYIFTKLETITRKIFLAQDDVLLNYLDDDGFPVEPCWYVPIIPMVLVNGCEGIGVGWSTQCPCFNPRDIVANIKRLLNNQSPEPMIPWYFGFKVVFFLLIS